MKLLAWCVGAMGWLFTSFAVAAVAPDTLSDQVGGTPGQFRVDESGSATYSIPIYTPPGITGVVPKVALSYSSQASDGPLGKGWSISGLSSITRCRATREAGDFIVGGQPVDGDPKAINFTASDQFCLDGQRLIPAPSTAATCAALSGATATQYRGEIDSQQRVCAYTFDPNFGPRFFTVERKDGSTSWFGDRRTTTGTSTTGDYPNGALEGNGANQAGKVLSWALTRFQDSTGNYIDYSYILNPAGTSYVGEQHLSRIAWTGKNVLAGQAGSAQAPYQWIDFNYAAISGTPFSHGYASGSSLWQTQQLNSVTVSAENQQVRFYNLAYQYSIASPHARLLASLQECVDSTMAVCKAATTFANSAGQTSFTTNEGSTSADFRNLVAYKLADVDGDGRLDLIWLKKATDTCTTEHLYVSYGELDASGNLTFNGPPQGGYCMPLEMTTYPSSAWFMLDYNGDGRADIMLPTANGVWAVFASTGRPLNGSGPFDTSNNLLASLSPAIPPLATAQNPYPYLADLNGDGQIDLLYKGASGGYAGRIAERKADGTWGWGKEYTLLVNSSAADPCVSGVYDSCGYTGFQSPGDHQQMYDFDGDSRSDLVLNLAATYQSGGSGCQPLAPARQSATSGAIPMRAPAATTAATTSLATTSTCKTLHATWTEVMGTQHIDVAGSTITLQPLFSWQRNDGVNKLIDSIKFADVNGDGVTDAIVRYPTATSTGTPAQWQVQLNDGTGNFQSTQANFTLYASFPSISNYDNNVQIVDINGDGRADLVYPTLVNNSPTGLWSVRYAQPDGTYAAEAPLPGGQARVFAYGNQDVTNWIPIFADFDGDGTVDSVLIRTDTQGIYISRTSSGSRFQPHDVIQRITDGNGAVTNMLYSPLTNAAVYRPDYNSRNTLNYGRGSPVVDLLAPMYVVAYVESSAPVYGNPSALSYVYHLYSGAKMQGGGRGFLGFREITTIDANHPNQFVATTTNYQQSFPFVGSPQTTYKRVVNGAFVPAACLTGIVSSNSSGNACFLPPGNPFTAFAGTDVSKDTQIWEASPAFAAGVQQSMQVRTTGTEDKLRDLASGATTSDVWTSFSYDNFGNVTGSTVDTYSDDAVTKVSSVVTANTYTNNEARWRLGRLTASTVTHTRGTSSVIRKTAFSYDMISPAMTGLLLSEEIQPGGTADQDRRTVYTLDAYGNRISATTCTQDIVSCGTTGVNFHPVGSGTPSTSVQRYSRTAYDSLGHYPTSTYEPFWNGTGTTEVKTQQVLARDVLGNVLQAVDAKNVNALAVPGSFGNQYYSWAQTVPNATVGDPNSGAESWATYRWCGTGTNQVSCPRGAVFRQRSVTKGAPSKWTYYDVLGRPLLAVGQTFNTGVAQQEFAGVCSYSDAVGRAERTSNPFFLSDPNNGGDPSFAVQTDPCGSRNWAITRYDVLGRPLQVTFADGTTVSSVYAGMLTTSTDQLGHQTKVTKNALGEKASVTDSAGLTTSYAYDGAGDLLSVTRNGGRGNIVTSYVYDALGRKTSQTDGDTGTYSYAYNAAGDLLKQTDAKGQWIASDYDARGRVWRKTAYTAAGAVESTSQFMFDTDPSAPGPQTLGALVSESVANNITASDTMSRGYTYDALGRSSGKTHTIDGNTYAEAVLYDTLGRVQESKDATSHWLRTQYAPNGFVQRQCEGDGSNTNACTGAAVTIYLQTNATDNWGHVTSENRGPVATTRSYDPYNGRLQSTCSGPSCNLQNETYTWDNKGNLYSRSRGTTYTEKFQYDANDRVTLGWYSVLNNISYAMPVNPATDVNVTEWMSYDALGNICRRTVPGAAAATSYTYSKLGGCGLAGLPGGVNAGSTANSGYQLLAAGNENYITDANGSMTLSTTGAGGTGTVLRGWNYDTQNRAVEVYKGATPVTAALRTRWDYDAGGARFRRTDDGTAGPSGTTLYLDNVERVTTGANVTWRRTIAGVAVMALVGTNPSLPTTNYLLHDHIGSIVAVANTSGALVERGDYSAFGGMRTTMSGVSVGLAALGTTTRGFTGHEQLGSLDLIHMNGRVYDYALGRFLSVDPFIQFPLNSQSLNPYSYILNNPLSGTDPTGYADDTGVLEGKPQVEVEPPTTQSVYHDAPTGSHIASNTTVVASNGSAVVSVTYDKSGGVVSSSASGNLANGGSGGQGTNTASPGMAPTATSSSKGSGSTDAHDSNNPLKDAFKVTVNPDNANIVVGGILDLPKALAGLKEGTKDYSYVERVLDFAKNPPKNVTEIYLNANALLDGDIAGQADRVNVRHQNESAWIDFDMRKIRSPAAFAGVLGHELSHEASPMPTTKQEEMQGELTAYSTQRAIGRGLKVNFGLNSERDIRRQAEKSTKAWCTQSKDQGHAAAGC